VARALVALGAASGMTLGLVLGLPATAHADQTVVVRGTAFPGPEAQLAYIGCDDLFTHDDQVVTPTIGRGPGRAPSGARSLGYDLAGGTAIGSQHVVPSVIGNNIATLSVFAPEGVTGRAVVGYQSPLDQGTSVMWFGVAPISAPAGGWTTVGATPRAYSWAKYDMATRRTIEAASGPPVPVGEFVAGHGGDGPGLYALTFGCDGAPFSMDAMRIGSPGDVTTFDIEGLATSLTITGSSFVVHPGEQVTLHGTLGSTGPIAHTTVILERRDLPGGTWENVRVVPVGETGAVARLNPTRTALYRWRFVDRPLAEGTVSQPFLVTVLPVDLPEQVPTPTPTPTPPTTPDPTPTPTLPPPPDPTDPPTPEPTQPEASTSASASAEPTPSATPPATASATPSVTSDAVPSP
jgi:hypothetical protein